MANRLYSLGLGATAQGAPGLPHLLAVGVVAALLVSSAAAASKDFPVRWDRVGPEGGAFKSVAIDPAQPSTIYAGSFSGQIYRSDDRGETWAATPLAGFWGHIVEDIEITRNGIYAGLWGAGGGGGALVLSSDGGATWQRLHSGLAVRALAVSPRDPRRVYIGSYDGVHRSDDGGRTFWKLPFSSPVSQVESLALDPGDPDRLWAGTWRRAYTTTDGGATWRPVHDGMVLDSDVFSLAISPASANVVFAGTCGFLYRSDDGGRSWRKRVGELPMAATRVYSVLPASDGVVFAGTSHGLYLSTNGGETFSELGAVGTAVHDMAYDARSQMLYSAALPGGIFRYDVSSGALSRPVAGIRQTTVRAMVAHRDYGGVLFAAVSPDSLYGGIHLSVDGGQTWERLMLGRLTQQIESLAVVAAADMRAPDTLLVGTTQGVYLFYGAGRFWQLGTLLLAERRVNVLAAAADGKTVWVGTDGGVFALRDFARQSYAAAAVDERDFPAAQLVGLERQWITSLLPISWRGGAALLAGSRQGLFGLGSDGVSELLVNDTVPYAMVFTDGAFLVGTSRGLLRSDDNGASFQWVNPELPRGTIRALAVRPGQPREVALGLSEGGGLWSSFDGGRSWRFLGDETLGVGAYGALFSGEARQTLFVGTSEAGIWRLDWARLDGATAAAARPAGKD
ncbi:MAG: hypothetical protein HYV63_32630 [Candidatus Schekmanbacteria bacterium]|nr:hypothetical protein [Candidatus Schekmanbacteria bacterium]